MVLSLGTEGLTPMVSSNSVVHDYSPSAEHRIEIDIHRGAPDSVDASDLRFWRSSTIVCCLQPPVRSRPSALRFRLRQQGRPSPLVFGGPPQTNSCRVWQIVLEFALV